VALAAASALCAATPWSYASSSDSHSQYNATAAGAASGTFTVKTTGDYLLVTTRPSSRARFAAFEVASATSSAYLFYAYVDHAARVFCTERRRTGQIEFGSFCASGSFGGGRGPGGARSLPDTLDVGSLRLTPGRYRLTMLTREPTSISLVPNGRAQRSTAIHLTPDPDANAVVATYQGQDVSQNTYRELPLRIPNHAHAAFVVIDQRWTGNSSVHDVGACFGQVSDQAQCFAEDAAISGQVCVESALSYCAIEPSPDNSTQGETDFISVDEPPAGDGAGVYSVISGSITRQSIVAVALP
jgi:hypothetical protein